MTIRKYRVVEWDAALTYLLPFVLLCVASVWVTAAGLPTPAIIAVIATTLAWGYAGVLRYFWPRLQAKKAIVRYTRHGIRVFVPEGPARVWLSARWDELDGNIDLALTFWNTLYPDREDVIEESLNGASLYVKVTDSGFTAPPVAGMGVMREGGDLVMRGSTEGKSITIAWEPGNQGKLFFTLVRHELSHLFLKALGSMGGTEAEHKEMRRLGSPDA